MDTFDELVRLLLNKEFMKNQREEVEKRRKSEYQRRMDEKELWEIEREKRLILEGKMSIDDAPYIADHPVFAVSKMTTSILEEKKKKVAEQLKPKIPPSPDYDQMRGGAEDADSDDDGLLPLDDEELEKARILWDMQQKIEAGDIFSQEDADKIKYEDPLVKKLRTVETVSEMYSLADEILGPVAPRYDRHGNVRYHFQKREEATG